MFKLNLPYLSLAIILFIIEVLIALYVHDSIIRPFGGDYLVVILLYCLLKGFVDLPVRQSALIVLLFSYLVEGLQYLQIVHHLGLDDSKLANIVIGNYFSWVDILCYSLGIITVLIVEILISKTGNHASTHIHGNVYFI
jgi:hypothetical protein